MQFAGCIPKQQKGNNEKRTWGETVLAYVIACLAASGSFLLNRMLLKQIGFQTVITISPALEEMVKTLPAYYFSADILVTHFAFGLIEAVYDWLQTRERIAAAVFSIIGHSLFGGVTVWAAHLTGIYVGLAAGIVIHLLWNTIMVKWGSNYTRNE